MIRFCPQCGASVAIRMIEHKQRAYCPACHIVHYEHLKIGAAALVERGNSVLLMRRAHDPFLGCWNLPAGYVEADESPADAAIREAKEECGLDVRITGLLGVFFFDDDPRGNGILIVYRCEAEGEPIETSEATAPTFFARNEIPSDIAGAGHGRALSVWLEAAG